MARRPRRNHTASFKTKMALAAIREEYTLGEIAQQNDVHANQRWSYYFDQLAAILRWIIVSFRLPILLVLLFFHKPLPASIFRGSNAAA